MTFSSCRVASLDLLRRALQLYCNLSHSCRKHGGSDLSCSDRACFPGSKSPNHKRHKSNASENVPDDSRQLHWMRKIDYSDGTMHGGQNRSNGSLELVYFRSIYCTAHIGRLLCITSASSSAQLIGTPESIILRHLLFSD